jgi:hypothetical protein
VAGRGKILEGTRERLTNGWRPIRLLLGHKSLPFLFHNAAR